MSRLTPFHGSEGTLANRNNRIELGAQGHCVQSFEPLNLTRGMISD